MKLRAPPEPALPAQDVSVPTVDQESPSRRERVFRQVRRVIPPIGGLDFSPIVVFVIIWFLQYSINWASFRYGY